MRASDTRQPLRIGVVGCGGSRQTFGPAVADLDSMCVTALMDVDLASARIWSKKVRGARAFCEFDEFLAESDVQAAIVSSPPQARAGQIAALLATGRHVLAETPIAPTSAETCDLASRARSAGLILAPAMLLRFEPAVTSALAGITAGVIGDIRELRCEWEFSSAWTHRKAVLQSWPAVLMRHAIRTIDLARWWLGDAYAVSADIDRASSGRRTGALANLIVQHDRGVSVHHIHRVSGRPRFEHYVATGSAGAIELSAPAAGALDGAATFLSAVRHTGEPSAEAGATANDSADAQATPEAHRYLAAQFARSVHDGTDFPVTAFDASAAQAILEAALVSSADGLKITLSPQATQAIDRARA